MLCVARKIMKVSLRKFISSHQIVARCSTQASTSQNATTQQGRSRNFLQPMYGQPTRLTHPHLIKEGELLPGIKLEEFRNRRNKLITRILTEPSLERKPDQAHILIIPSATKAYMSEKIPYVFRQNTDFLYFTGCQEPDSALIITGKGDQFTSTLFIQKKDPHTELWDGPRTGVEAALYMFGMDQALPVSELEKFFATFMHEHRDTKIWYEGTEVVQPKLHEKLWQLVRRSEKNTFESPKKIIHQIRLFKSDAEIELMQKSCDVASAAIAKTIEISKPGMTEHQLFATVDYECRMNGAEYLAYPPVVAGGNNANVIHYITNNQVVQDGEMVLMDAGCEYHSYTADITRTWPINGKFTPQQRVLYEIVLEVQKQLIERLKDMPTLDQVFQEMCLLLGKRLQEIGLIPKSVGDDKLLAAAYLYCPHHVSHYLGMDVHDTGSISRSLNIQPGMIVTVEPGIYVNAKNKLAPPEFHGLGIRIEDDVLITKDGPVVLTRNCPKEISEIETLAKENQS